MVNRHDVTSGLFWLVIAGFVGIQAYELGVGAFSNPGAGFILFWSSIFLAILSCVTLIQGIRRNSGGSFLADSWREMKWLNVVIAVAGLLAYALLLTRFGFLLTSFLFMVLLYWLGKTKPWIAVAGAFVTIAATYALFHIALQVNLPRGFMGW